MSSQNMSALASSIFNVRVPEPFAIPGPRPEDDEDAMQSAALRKTVYYSYGVQNLQGKVDEEQEHSYENTIEVNKDDIGEEQVVVENH